MSDFNETITIQHNVTGTLSAAAGAVPYPVPFPCELVGVTAAVGTAPTSADILIDVNKNGTTVFTDQANRVKIKATETVGSVAVAPALAAGTNYIWPVYPTAGPIATFSAGDKITVDVDQVGSGTAGSNRGVVLVLAKK